MTYDAWSETMISGVPDLDLHSISACTVVKLSGTTVGTRCTSPERSSRSSPYGVPVHVWLHGTRDLMVWDTPLHLLWVCSINFFLRSCVMSSMLRCAKPAACAMTVSLTLSSTSSDGMTIWPLLLTSRPASLFLSWPNKLLF